VSQIAQYLGTGKRKTSVARVILRPGDGSTWINGRTIEEYFPRQVLQALATAPLRVAGVEGKFDRAAKIFEQMSTQDEFAEFLTLPAYDHLD